MSLDPSSSPDDHGTARWSISRRVVEVHDGSERQLDFATSDLPAASSSSLFQYCLSQVRDKLVIAFLPNGYPHSVTADYKPYTIYSFLHSVTGTITGTLSTQALLHALGMGAAVAAGLAATTNWIIKDGFGLLGGVIYAGVTANRFDSSPKRYRFLSAAAIQLATFVEILTPMVPHLFLPLASISNVCKNIGWIATSATKASMHKAFTREDNLGDVTAKAGAQATAAGLLGTSSGILLSYFIGSEPSHLLLAFAPLCAINMWFAYCANEAFITRTINLERAELLFADCARRLASEYCRNPHATAQQQYLKHISVPSPAEVSSREQFIFRYRSVFAVPIALEPSLPRRLESIQQHTWNQFVTGEIFGPGRSTERYRLLMIPAGKMDTSDSWKTVLAPRKVPHDPHVCCWFTVDATTEDILKGFYHACILRALLEQASKSDPELTEERAVRYIQATYNIAGSTFDEVVQALRRSGWFIDHTHLGDRNARLRISE
ncbi:hypothetical protein HDU85_006220 [Gaertneriomyces sp. JEL0708]|nr:hypothetical protein HDU85_006220 [Gaertneriomyces sp. JEL0708]